MKEVDAAAKLKGSPSGKTAASASSSSRKTAVLYLRSAGVGDPSIEAQRKALEAVAARRGWRILRAYIDQRPVNRRDQREARSCLFRDIARLGQGFRGMERIDVVLLTAFDRIADDAAGLLRFVNACASKSADVYALDESVDTATPSGQAVLDFVRRAMAIERMVMAENVRVGVANARLRGRRGGRPRGPITDAGAVEALDRHGSLRAAGDALGVSDTTIFRRVRAAKQAADAATALAEAAG